MERRARFELVYRRWSPAVKAYALRRTDAAAADDIVAEVFVIAWRRLDELPAEPLPWLLGVARRRLSEQRRSERRRAGLAERLAQQSPPVPPAGGDDDLARALARLSDGDRELLLLIAWDGLAPREAAAVLSVKQATLRVRLLRARRRLRAALADQDEVPAQPLKASMEVSR